MPAAALPRVGYVLVTVLLETLIWFATPCFGLDARPPDRGLNLPPTQGTSGNGAFIPGVYTYEYQPEQIMAVAGRAGFSALRLPINIETASDKAALHKLKTYIDVAGGRGIICMFGTAGSDAATAHGNGRINDVAAAKEAWQNIHSIFADYHERVLYELFNEPWGYSDPAEYYTVMTGIIKDADLPADRCILDGLGYASDVQSVARAGWKGYLGYHVYPWYLPEQKRTQGNFTEKIEQDLKGLSSRVFLTEFGAALDHVGLASQKLPEQGYSGTGVTHVDSKTSTSDWRSEWPATNEMERETYARICQKYPRNVWCGIYRKGAAYQHTRLRGTALEELSSEVADINSMYLNGLRIALNSLKTQGFGVRGVYFWHGWHNSDSYDYWDASNAGGARVVEEIMRCAAESLAPVVHMAAIPLPEPITPCPADCESRVCADGDDSNGGRLLTWVWAPALTTWTGQCAHSCSALRGDARYCGAGAAYAGAGSVDCRSCARPAVCSGLPCWNNTGPPALPEQGYTGASVKHVANKTMTHDWRGEWPAQDETKMETYERICRKYPENAWCKAHKEIAATDSNWWQGLQGILWPS